MLEILDKQKIEKLKEQIKVDMSKLIGEGLVLPFEFFEPEKVKKGIYKISSPVFELNGQFYPMDLFGVMAFMMTQSLHLFMEIIQLLVRYIELQVMSGFLELRQKKPEEIF